MITIANANAKHIPLPDRSVQCVVTSPPYWGLRDYGTAKWEGGLAECDHVEPKGTTRGGPNSTLSGGQDLTPHNGQYKSVCLRCGAHRIDAQIGLEPTPAAYVASIVAVMRECWRVLKDDGVLWLNLGDSYNSAASNQQRDSESSTLKSNAPFSGLGRRGYADGLKPKDLCGIPWRVAFALQSDGAASPETMMAVSRIRAALLSDFDSWDAVPDKTRNVIESLDREWEDAHRGAWYLRQDIIWNKPNPMPESVTDRCTKAHEYVFLLTKQARYYYDAISIQESSNGQSGQAANFARASKEAEVPGQNNKSHRLDRDATFDTGTRNRRSVWTVATQPYSGAHFATWPPKLIEPMILAGSRRGDVVLDPFAGSGTTGQVAVRHGRRAVMLDLNTKYIDLQFERTSGIQVNLL